MTHDETAGTTSFELMQEMAVEIYAVKKAGEPALTVELEGRVDMLAWAVGKVLDAMADKMGWTKQKLIRRMELAWMMTEALTKGADGDGD